MIRFGTVGTNWIVDSFIKAGLHDSRFSVTAAYSRTQNSGSTFAKKHSIPEQNVFTNLEKMAKSGLVDAVYIASPTALHAQHAKLCLENNLAVLCEKPMTTNANEARELVALAEEKNILLMHAMKTMLEPRMRKLAEMLPQIGTIRQITSSRCQYSSRYDSFKLGELPNAFNPDLGNGAAMDIGIYLVQPIVSLLGKPESIQASATKLSSGVDGAGSLILGYKQAEAILCFSKISNAYTPTELQGEEGSLLLPNHNEKANPPYIVFHPKNGEKKFISIQQNLPDMAYEIQEFIDLYEQGLTDSTFVPNQTMIATMEILDEYRKQINLVFPNDSKSY